jgi:hypothetical protein
MNRVILVVLSGWVVALAADDPADSSQIPQALRRFEPLIGEWKGTTIPTANRLKGWRENHVWAWRFKAGHPVGVSVTFNQNKVLTAARIDPGDQANSYVLSGDDAEGKPVRLEGVADASGRAITFESMPNKKAGDASRLVLRILDTGNRYTLWFEQREPGATSWTRVYDTGLGRASEEIAAGDEDRKPKCIVTGGAASLSVTVEGRTFLVCCTGCRDEVMADPQKYIAKLEGKPGASAKPTETAIGKPPSAGDAKKPIVSAPEKPAEKLGARSKSAELFGQAHALDSSGKKAAAITFYRRIVREFPKEPEAAKASERLKVLGAQ